MSFGGAQGLHLSNQTASRPVKARTRTRVHTGGQALGEIQHCGRQRNNLGIHKDVLNATEPSRARRRRRLSHGHPGAFSSRPGARPPVSGVRPVFCLVLSSFGGRPPGRGVPDSPGGTFPSSLGLVPTGHLLGRQRAAWCPALTRPSVGCQVISPPPRPGARGWSSGPRGG